jgi:hypothetical protein
MPDVPIILFTLHAQTLQDFDLKNSSIRRVLPKTEMIRMLDHAGDLIRSA